MEVHLTSEHEAQLTGIAASIGTGAEEPVKNAVARLLEEDARFRAAVGKGATAGGPGLPARPSPRIRGVASDEWSVALFCNP
jgi:hypothetical protein